MANTDPVNPFIFPRQVFCRPQLAGQRTHQEESEFRGGFGEHVGSIGEGNPMSVGVGAIDIVEANGELSHDFERVPTCVEDFASILSRSVVIRPSIPDFTFSTTSAFGGGSG